MLSYSEIQEYKKKLFGQWKPGDERLGVFRNGELFETVNQAEDPEKFFEFLEEDLEGAEATWHTHPQSNANLSIEDFWFFKSWSNLVHFIVSNTEVRCYLVFKGLVYSVDAEEDYPPRPPG